jgi:hypothetical protein
MEKKDFRGGAQNLFAKLFKFSLIFHSFFLLNPKLFIQTFYCASDPLFPNTPLLSPNKLRQTNNFPPNPSKNKEAGALIMEHRSRR